jgi:hypothetical protein
MGKIELLLFAIFPSPAYTKIKTKENITLLQTTNVPYIYFRHIGSNVQDTIAVYKYIRISYSEILEI